MLACDVRVAARDTRFGQIEIKRGIYPVGGATLRMPRELGWGNAMRWLLTGDELGAEEALRIGLVQELVEPGEQLERALALGERIAAQAPLGVRATLASARLALSGRGGGGGAALARFCGRSWPATTRARACSRSSSAAPPASPGAERAAAFPPVAVARRLSPRSAVAASAVAAFRCRRVRCAALTAVAACLRA